MDSEARIVELEMREAALEQQVQTLLRQLDLPGAMNAFAPNLEEIKQLLLAGRKIDAIRRYREMSRLGLREAKDKVEELDRQLKG